VTVFKKFLWRFSSSGWSLCYYEAKEGSF
jgi:hypothetical protein